MKCHRCGSTQVQEQFSDLPFKLDTHQVLIVKNVPCHVCEACGETLLDDKVLASVDRIIENVRATRSELDVVPYPTRLNDSVARRSHEDRLRLTITD